MSAFKPAASDDQPSGARQQSEQQALGHQLAHDAAAAGANGGPNGDFARPRGCFGK